MVDELVLDVIAAAMARRAVHVALHDVRHLALAVAGAALGHGFLLGKSALPILASFNLGIEDFDSLLDDVGSDTAATFATLLAVGSDLGFVRPAGNRDVAENRVGHAGGQIALEALSSFTGVVDGEGSLFVPAEQFVHHGLGFLTAIEQGEGRTGTGESATDGTPVTKTALEHFHDGIGEGVVGSAKLLSHGSNDSVESTVTAAKALVPVALVGDVHGSGDVVDLMSLPAKQAVLLIEQAILTASHFRSSGGSNNVTGHSGDGTTNSQTTHSTKHCSSAEIHNILRDKK